LYKLFLKEGGYFMPKNIQKTAKLNKKHNKSLKNNEKSTTKLNKKIYENLVNQIENYSEIENLETEESDNFEKLSNLSIEELLKKEFKNIIRICDICGSEMNLDIDCEKFEIFVCNNCGYKIKVDNSL
jgi:DNA-directed RNA polymerase beta' subunit